MISNARARHVLALVALASYVHVVHSKSGGASSGRSTYAPTRSLAINEDVNRTATVEIADAAQLQEGDRKGSVVEALDASLAASLERSRRFQGDQLVLREPDEGEAVDAAVASLALAVTEVRSGPLALAKKLMCGTTLLVADLTQWRRLRLLPEDSLTYDEVTSAVAPVPPPPEHSIPMSHTSVCVRVGLAPGALAERDACHAAPHAAPGGKPAPAALRPRAPRPRQHDAAHLPHAALLLGRSNGGCQEALSARSLF